MSVTHVHQSGHASATYPEWIEAIDWLNTHVQPKVMTFTETSSTDAARALSHFVKDNSGWYLAHAAGAGADECAILAREPIHAITAKQLTPLALKTARQAPINRVSGTAYGIRFHVWHSPAHNGGLSDNGSFGWPTKVYLDAWGALRQARGASRVVAADWNVDLHRDDMRKRLALPGMSWAYDPNQHGTDGARLIDGMQSNLKAKEVHTLPDYLKGFDHRGVVAVW